ncbi:hypothetical protein [Parapedobacter sp. 10938]|uniref:hypothetical protein n=1 Tax=Parapedobacter flavus TaxID=3110225 RepID=UPI002DBDB516|nr:hypothetical protein [Parapedobacter sp. 10938]MEC3881474.1 hypothetical protein [Parapedobacter sp. 10938]
MRSFPAERQRGSITVCRNTADTQRGSPFLPADNLPTPPDTVSTRKVTDRVRHETVAARHHP